VFGTVAVPSTGWLPRGQREPYHSGLINVDADNDRRDAVLKNVITEDSGPNQLVALCLPLIFDPADTSDVFGNQPFYDLWSRTVYGSAGDELLGRFANLKESCGVETEVLWVGVEGEEAIVFRKMRSDSECRTTRPGLCPGMLDDGYRIRPTANLAEHIAHNLMAHEVVSQIISKYGVASIDNPGTLIAHAAQSVRQIAENGMAIRGLRREMEYKHVIQSFAQNVLSPSLLCKGTVS
jgi:hypothetical protein